ncbi:MAG TPA: hypothetical protein VE525_08755 [Rubrobacter sp.]|jgi:hypothetical protein|nr:hypothetical protein [Rubrobacter sp.]
MVDRGRARDVNEAARRFAESLAESYRLVYAQAAESGERQQRRAQEFSELVARNLREQTEASRSTAQKLSEQADRQQEAGQEFVRESVEAYAQFLDAAFSRYQTATERAAGTAAGVMGAATGTVADATASTVDPTAETAAFPIAGYDEMNVEEVSKRLGDFSVEELQLLRDYEERNKRRDTLLEQMDRKIRAT